MSLDNVKDDNEIDYDDLAEAPTLSEDDYLTIDRISAQQGDGDDLVSAGGRDRPA